MPLWLSNGEYSDMRIHYKFDMNGWPQKSAQNEVCPTWPEQAETWIARWREKKNILKA